MNADGLVAAFTAQRGALALSVDLSVAPGRVVAVVGPNGAGKSSLLAVLAGLVRPSAGVTSLGRTVLDDVEADIHVPTARRKIGVVFQDYLLFPHLTALENVAFGLRARGIPKSTAERRAAEALEGFGLAAHASSRPSKLSGGQAQRVALARALVGTPNLLLLDEPLAALDAGVRPELRANLSSTIRHFGGVTILVTHDPVDAMTLADEIIVLEAGVITHRSAPTDLASGAHTAFAADLVGLNFMNLSDGSSATFSPDSVLICPTPVASDHAFACSVLAVELGPSGLRIQLRHAFSSAVFWAQTNTGGWLAGVPNVGDRVWAEHPLFKD